MKCAYTFSDDVSTIISINLSPGLRAFTPLKKYYKWKKREKNIYVCNVYLNFPPYIISLIIHYTHKCINFYIIIQMIIYAYKWIFKCSHGYKTVIIDEKKYVTWKVNTLESSIYSKEVVTSIARMIKLCSCHYFCVRIFE